MGTAIWKNIGVMRGIAILSVVLNHAVLFQRSIRIYVGPKEPYDTFDAAITILGVTVPCAALAAFMIASGYFMGRFSDTWPNALGTARGIAIRYALWSVGGFAFLVAFQNHYTLSDIPQALLADFGPFSAYWFFAPMLATLLLCPLLGRWSRQRPWTVFAAVVGTETLRAGLHYLGPSISLRIVPFEMSFFVLGVLLAKHTEPIINTLTRHRRLVGYAMILLLVATFVETSYWWHVAGGPMYQVVTLNRLSMRLYSVAAVACFLLLPPPRQTKVNTVLNDIGTKSLAILLMFDFFQGVVHGGLFRLTRVLCHCDPAMSAFVAMEKKSVAILAFFVIGVGGPLLTVWLSERLLGKAWRRTLFG